MIYGNRFEDPQALHPDVCRSQRRPDIPNVRASAAPFNLGSNAPVLKRCCVPAASEEAPAPRIGYGQPHCWRCSKNSSASRSVLTLLPRRRLAAGDRCRPQCASQCASLHLRRIALSTWPSANPAEPAIWHLRIRNHRDGGFERRAAQRCHDHVRRNRSPPPLTRWCGSPVCPDRGFSCAACCD